MQKNLVLLLLLVCTTLKTFSQYYKATYKVQTLENTGNSNDLDSNFLRSLIMNSIRYEFISNKDLSYVSNTQGFSGSKGLQIERTGDTELFINYLNGLVTFDLNSKNFKIFNSETFNPVSTDRKLYNQYKLKKYINNDSTIIIYTTETLPWFIQPALFSKKTLNNGVVIMQNLRKGYELILTQVSKQSQLNTINKISTRIKLFKGEAQTSLSPFLQ